MIVTASVALTLANSWTTFATTTFICLMNTPMTQIKDSPFEKMEEEAKRNQAMLQTKVGQTKAHWLRREIEKLEEMRKVENITSIDETYESYITRNSVCIGHNRAITSIITRYKEELKVLESK